MIWTTLILAGLVTFFTRFSMIALLKKDYFSPRVKIVLSYIPSAVFPAIIFPAIFLNSTGQLVFLDNQKVFEHFPESISFHPRKVIRQQKSTFLSIPLPLQVPVASIPNH